MPRPEFPVVGTWGYNMPRPMKGVPNPNAGRRFPVEVLTPDEVHALMAACSPRSSLGLRNRALIVVMYRGGLRVSEALALYPKDVDSHAGAISVLRGKGGKRRTVGLDPGGLAVVQRWLDRRERLGITGHKLLFCTVRGDHGPLATSYVRQLLPYLAQSAGIAKRVHAHALRHTHAFELVNEGTPMPIIQKQLGHSHLQTTARYLDHFAPAQVLATISARAWNGD